MAEQISLTCYRGDAKPREGSLFDTLVIAGAGVIAASNTFFNRSADTNGAHLCNLPNVGMISAGDRFVVTAIAWEFVGTVPSDIDKYVKNFTFDLSINQREYVRRQVVSMYPQPGGAFGIEGANGGSANGSQTWTAVKPLADPITIEGTQQIRVYLNLGTGATPAVAGAAGVFLRCHLIGFDFSA